MRLELPNADTRRMRLIHDHLYQEQHLRGDDLRVETSVACKERDVVLCAIRMFVSYHCGATS